MSDALAKIAKMNALVKEVRDTITDIRERLDRIEKEDRKRAAMQNFVIDAPTNGAQHPGLIGFTWKG